MNSGGARAARGTRYKAAAQDTGEHSAHSRHAGPSKRLQRRRCRRRPVSWGAGGRNWAYYAFGSAAGETLPDKLDLDTGIEGTETTVTRFADGNVEVWTIEEGEHVPAFPDDFNRRGR